MIQSRFSRKRSLSSDHLGHDAAQRGIAPTGAGEIRAPVYSMELLGDATLVTVRAGDSFLAVKANKTFRAAIGEPIGFGLSPAACHVFDRRDGTRLQAGTP